MLQYIWPFRNSLIRVLPNDPTSQANWQEVVTKHIDFNWFIDFDLKLIFGSVTHTLVVKKDGLTSVVFDTADLDISKAMVNDDPKGAPYTLGESNDVMGSALSITLPTPAAAGQILKVSIHYSTTTRCMALGWREKEQTMGGQFPFLFSQCQPIYMRSLAPCQDTPSVKATYSAVVYSTLPTLMSALRVSPPVDGPPHNGMVIGKDRVAYIYNQPIPVSSYLIAVAAGNVVYKGFQKVDGKDWKSGIWTEPELMDRAHDEFELDTPKFLETEEAIVGPYNFGVYNLPVLPLAFPYGCMENCCLSFLTPALIVGDRALVDVVVHELTHSWFGNGVTHANATHFWLNEGWTTYMERVLQEKIHSAAARGFSYIIGRKALDDSLRKYQDNPRYQRLVIPFDVGENPDDAYSDVPYEKGSNFLLYLERTLGGLDVFLPYAKDYVETFTGQSITTDQWKDHLYDYFRKNGGSEKIKALDSVNWDAWLNGEGLNLPTKMEYDTSLAQPAYDLAARWEKSRVSDPTTLFHASDIASFDSNQKVVFLQTLQSYDPLSKTHIDVLATIYGFDNNPNVEISFAFYVLSMQDKSSSAAKAYVCHALDWVVGKSDGMVKGRMKYNRPIFLAASYVDYHYFVTLKAYMDNRLAFHPIAHTMIEKDIGIPPIPRIMS